ncbi:hypothetical protein [Acetanaerobacterium elongatum]|uniref:Uncharacterized protein n=1 Tax=Acetanaerobacterium elongatum TaxID=258515 RepID=A0A1H0EAG4_9FIRM|nr:hypothetical protein [Acetanaerobacterium elongatum]SDN79360.1 hypothetical protein SAMN05192585_13233 [Acetanaerobacterium elongatum]
MIKLELFNGKKTYMFPNGEVATPERIKQQFPAVEVFPHVLEVNGNVCQAVQELAAMRSSYGIDDALTDAQALEAMQKMINSPPPAPEPSAQERIAAALEFQNLINM